MDAPGVPIRGCPWASSSSSITRDRWNMNWKRCSTERLARKSSSGATSRSSLSSSGETFRIRAGSAERPELTGGDHIRGMAANRPPKYPRAAPAPTTATFMGIVRAEDRTVFHSQLVKHSVYKIPNRKNPKRGQSGQEVFQ